MKGKRSPALSSLLLDAALTAKFAASDASSCYVDFLRGASGLLEDPFGAGAYTPAKSSPVTTAHTLRTRADLHKIALATWVGREWYVRNSVPPTNTSRLVVMIRIGGSVSTTHKGVMRRIRIRRVVRAGL